MHLDATSPVSVSSSHRLTWRTCIAHAIMRTCTAPKFRRTYACAYGYVCGINSQLPQCLCLHTRSIYRLIWCNPCCIIRSICAASICFEHHMHSQSYFCMPQRMYWRAQYHHYCTYNELVAGASNTAAAISPNGGSGGGSCLDVLDNGQITSSATAAAPTALSLAAPPPPLHHELHHEKDGSLDSVLMQRRVHYWSMAGGGTTTTKSIAVSSPRWWRRPSSNSSTAATSCRARRSVSDQRRTAASNGFFEVDFI